MRRMTASTSRRWTIAGLLIALFGIPLIVTASRLLADNPKSDGAIAVREAAILALTAFLLWIVVSQERRPLSSIQLRFDRLGITLVWGFGLAVVCFAVLLLCLIGFSALGIRYGEGGSVAPSLTVALLTVLRAGISEEVFYRGFAIERMQEMFGSKWVAAGISLVIFAGFHYRQGLPGIFLAFVIGAVLTAFYLWKRNLLAAIFAHFIVDFVPNILLPLLGTQD
jgi:membrane protease YdiL (CAAX protease family)